jgi:hypothetical protein
VFKHFYCTAPLAFAFGASNSNFKQEIAKPRHQYATYSSSFVTVSKHQFDELASIQERYLKGLSRKTIYIDNNRCT